MKKYIYFTISLLSFNISPTSLSAGVNVETYHKANPDSLDAITEDIVAQSGDRIGGGFYGIVYSLEIPDIGNGQQFIRKEGNIDDEATIGQLIRNKRRNITPQTQLADIQGLELVVAGKKIKDGSLVQERIQGETLADFMRSFPNGWIDSPQKALERLCGLMSSLYALEKAGIVHGDLHTKNLMVEKKSFPMP
jgi:hypothetical protein